MEVRGQQIPTRSSMQEEQDSAPASANTAMLLECSEILAGFRSRCDVISRISLSCRVVLID